MPVNMPACPKIAPVKDHSVQPDRACCVIDCRADAAGF
jgi:hypothetical protein